MTPMEAIKTCFRKYLVLSGRAPRAEFWWFALFWFVGAVIASILDKILFGIDVLSDAKRFAPTSEMYNLAMLPATLTVSVRRMQDVGQNGRQWLIGLTLIYVFGYGMLALNLLGVSNIYEDSSILMLMGLLLLGLLLAFLWYAIRPSYPTTNEYGPNPYEVSL